MDIRQKAYCRIQLLATKRQPKFGMADDQALKEPLLREFP